MSARRLGPRFTLTLGACALLAACATQPRHPAPPVLVIAHPSPPAPTLAPLPKAEAVNPPWTGMIARFALDDCADSALIRDKARLYTRNPERFEQQLQQMLPLLMYVDGELQRAGVPAEFSLLPMVESEFRPGEPGRRGDPAGMWQLMPHTARLHGLVVSRSYDGRLDPVASTAAAAAMLQSLGREFGDWRLADMAYNAGPYAIARMLPDHSDATRAPIPKLPVSATTRNHLAKLLALACIIRQPERFNVALPAADADDYLATAEVPAGIALADAARMAGVPLAHLRALNPGYLGRTVPANSPRTLLLPAEGARALAAALATGPAPVVAEAGRPAHSEGPPRYTSHHHRVTRGETLWSIASRFHIGVDQLRAWNDLDGDALQPGQMLRLDSPN